MGVKQKDTQKNIYRISCRTETAYDFSKRAYPKDSLQAEEARDCRAAIRNIKKKTDKSIGHATVYRTLKLLVEAGIARELNFGEGSIRYEPDTDNTHHDHLVCVNCGENVEFFNEEIEKLQNAIAEKHGYKLQDHSMNLYGTCSKCQEKE